MAGMGGMGGDGGKGGMKGMGGMSGMQGPPGGGKGGGQSGKRLSGTMKSFVPTKGYGFITCGAVGEDVFVSNKTSPGIQELLESLHGQFTSSTPVVGTAVQFTLTESKS